MKYRTLDGAGWLEIDGEAYPITYELSLIDMLGLSATGDLTGPLAHLMMAKQSQSCHLVLSDGVTRLKIVITEHRHGHPAQFKVKGDIPQALRP